MKYIRDNCKRQIFLSYHHFFTVNSGYSYSPFAHFCKQQDKICIHNATKMYLVNVYTERKFNSKLYFFYKKIYYFYSSAGTHSKCVIFIILNSSF